MLSETEPVHLNLRLDVGPNVDNDRIDSLVRRLRDEIRDLDVQTVELVRGPPTPAGARAGEVVALGEISVALLPVALPPLIGLLRGWLGRNRTSKIAPRVRIKTQAYGRSVELEYSSETMSAGDLKEIADTLMASLEQKEDA